MLLCFSVLWIAIKRIDEVFHSWHISVPPWDYSLLWDIVWQANLWAYLWEVSILAQLRWEDSSYLWEAPFHRQGDLPDWMKRRRQAEKQCSFLSLHSDCRRFVTASLKLLPPSLFHHVGLYPWIMCQNYILSATSCFCQAFCHNYEKVTNKIAINIAVPSITLCWSLFLPLEGLQLQCSSIFLSVVWNVKTKERRSILFVNISLEPPV